MYELEFERRENSRSRERRSISPWALKQSPQSLGVLKRAILTIGTPKGIISAAKGGCPEKYTKPPKPKVEKEKTLEAGKQVEIIPFNLPSDKRTKNQRSSKGFVLSNASRGSDREESKENSIANIQNVSPNRSSNVGGRQHKQFVIKRRSPSMTRDNTISKLPEQPDKASKLVKQSSIKYKSIVDQSKTATDENNMCTILNELPRVSSKSWVVVAAGEKEPLFGYKYTIRREVASLTKIMTLYTACKIIEDNRLSPDEYGCTISRIAATRIGTSALLRLDDRIRLRDLMYGKAALTV
jgi:hypothetical protein